MKMSVHRTISDLEREEVFRLIESKKERVEKDSQKWKPEVIKKEMEDDLARRVREALETPPLERMQRKKERELKQKQRDLQKQNSHLLISLNDSSENKQFKKWKENYRRLQSESPVMNLTTTSPVDYLFRDQLSKSNQDEYPGVFGLENCSEGIRNIRDAYSTTLERFPPIKPKVKHFYTKDGFLQVLKSGKLPHGFENVNESGRYKDKYGVVRSKEGPFWPSELVPYYPAPHFLKNNHQAVEPLYFQLPVSVKTVEKQTTQFNSRWRGMMTVYDSERSQRDYLPQPVPEGCCPNLVFESRFESANLRQARRVGQFEYELVLRTDLYTNRHTQWYYFRVTNALPGITYKFRIVNLLKRDSLYNYGMRPLIYSEKDAREEEIGWRRTGHHISYSNNIVNHTCPLLEKGISYYMLEWQMEFPHEDDTYYMAHCYPYTFTDLKEDVDTLLADPDRQQYINREVLCETRAGNSCFLLTVTNNEVKCRKKYIVISARVHPGETQASWMMRGLLYFITSQHQSAQVLRDTCIFKIVPMLNPDGVIVGNYRCSLAARDLNRNYRHPKHDNFPTIYSLKNMVDSLLQRDEVVLYCDLHGHSRKENVFMYGNNKETSGNLGNNNGQEAIQSFISDRVFPWLMAVKSPEKFSFNSCKFRIKRCKESTGRVVMWRQMKIPNSFTLEATFSGTILDKSSCRHFNCKDFEEMGETLCQAVLDYQTMQEDKEFENEILSGLTRAITHQILAKRGLLPKNMNLRDLHSGKVSDSGISVEGSDSSTGGQTDNDKPADSQSELHTTDNTANTQLSLATQKEVMVQNGRQVVEKQKTETSKLSTETSKQEKSVKGGKDVQKILEETSLNSLDSCMNILAQLNICEALLESDSSDSDSESEPEMKPPEIKQRKKKRKSRKQRDRENKKIENERKSSDTSIKTALPVITGRGSVSMTTKTEVSSSLKKQQVNIKRLEQVVTNQQFISKYQGRTNGGLPCYTEERSMERAAKRMVELQRRSEQGKEQELLLYYEDEFPYSRSISGLPLQRTVTEEEFNKRIQAAIHEGTSNLTQTLVGNGIKTSYSHTESTGRGMKSESYLQGIQQSPSFSLPITFPMVPSNNNNNNNTIDNNQPDSLYDDDVLEIRSNGRSLPITVQKSPYQIDISPTSRHHVRSGPVLRSLSQSHSTTTSPLVTAAILNKSSNQFNNHSDDNNIKITPFPNTSLIGNFRRSHVRNVTNGD